MVRTDDNTPPRSPEMDGLELDEADILEVIELDDYDEIMDDEEIPSEMGDEVDYQPPRDDSAVVLRHHTSCVLSCAFHPEKPNIIVTGGMDDVACVVDISSEEPKILLRCLAQESIDCVKFSNDGKYLCVIDVDGRVKVFNGEDYSLHHEFELEEEFKWMSWHHTAPVIVAATTSMINMYNIPTQASKLITTCSDGGITCGKLFPDGKRLVYGTSMCTVKVVDLKTGNSSCSASLKSPGEDTTIIYCLDIHKDETTVICGADSGDIFLINVESGKVAMFPRKSGNTEGVEVVEFAKTEELKNMAASCYLGGQLIVWDTTRQAVRSEIEAGSTIVGLKWHPSEPYIFACLTDAKVLMMDARSGALVRTYLGHTRMLLALDITRDGSRILTTSNDATARIFDVTSKEPESGMEVA